MFGRLVIEIARDSMSVSAFVFQNGSTKITEALIYKELEQRGITTGIVDARIKEMVRFGSYRKRWIVAKGTPSLKGKDGWYELLFDKDVKECEPKIREDGSVDYSPNIVIAEIGQKVAVYHPAMPGENGITVFGAAISPLPVREQKELRLLNVERVGNDFITTERGRVTFNGKRLAVLSHLIVNGNAGYATGMIDFSGDVHVKGDVKEGVVMKVGGTLEVDGEIEGAQITVGGNLIVRGGIHGKQKAQIDVGGAVTANFIEGATIVSKKGVTAGHIINADIKSQNSVCVEGKVGTILGGTIEAEECIMAKRIGSEKGCNTTLRIHSIDAWAAEYARLVVRDKVFPATSLEINGVYEPDCRLENGEIHLTENGLERFEIGGYQYKDVLDLLEEQSTELTGAGKASAEPVVEEKKLILVVDDDPVFLKTQYAYLMNDYRVGVVSSGADALKFLEQSEPDLILLDYLMPAMTGSDLLSNIRCLPSNKADVPVFFLTSVTDKKVIQQCLSLYPQKYLIKPMEKDELLKIIGDFFTNEQK